jgi:hypothetical protein
MTFACVSNAPFGVPVDRCSAAEQTLKLARDDLYRLHTGRLTAASERLLEAVPANHHARARVTQLVGHLAVLEQRVHRHHHGAQAQNPEVHDWEVRHVRHLQADSVPCLHPVRGQQPSRPLGGLIQSPIAEDKVVELDSRTVGVLVKMRRDQLREIGHAFHPLHR